MKFFRPLVLVLVLVLDGRAQTNPTITSFENGNVTFTNVNPSLEYRVEWASRATDTNGYSNVYNSVEYITPTSTAAMTVDVPTYFRIAGTNALSNNIVRASDLPTLINASTNAKIDLEWSESPNGPWFTNWPTALEKSRTGNVLTVTSPRFYRYNFVNCPSNSGPCVGTWTDSTDPVASRTIVAASPTGPYSPGCLKIKAGQSVTFSMSFGSHPLIIDCLDFPSMTNTLSGSSTTFTFDRPGYYSFHCNNHAVCCGMRGNIWVIP